MRFVNEVQEFLYFQMENSVTISYLSCGIKSGLIFSLISGQFGLHVAGINKSGLP